MDSLHKCNVPKIIYILCAYQNIYFILHPYFVQNKHAPHIEEPQRPLVGGSPTVFEPLNYLLELPSLFEVVFLKEKQI
jgi:hypothetical protein